MTPISDQLLHDLRLDNGITWFDEGTDRDLQNKAALGMAHLNELAGEPCDYMTPGKPRQLLFEYVRYARANALGVFEHNYQTMLLALQTKRQVSRYAEKNTLPSE